MMRKSILLIAVFFTLFVCLSCNFEKDKGDSYPAVVLKNSKLQATVLLPDSIKGYYRSTRYDWSGIIAQVEYEGHTFFQDWENFSGPFSKDKHDPNKAGTGTGTIEEFRKPIGYNEAKPGEAFVKIGVGVLKRKDTAAYHWDFPYEVITPGKWDVVVKEKQIVFTQRLSTAFGYAYNYEKIIKLSDTEPEIKIIHKLSNTGTKLIESNSYCHNFFNFDKKEISFDYEIAFPDGIKPVDEFYKDVLITDTLFKVNRDAINKFTGGHINANKSNRYVVKNTNTSTSVSVRSTAVYHPFYICMWDKAICPEPMVQFNIKPSETYTWTRTYQFNIP